MLEYVSAHVTLRMLIWESTVPNPRGIGLRLLRGGEVPVDITWLTHHLPLTLVKYSSDFVLQVEMFNNQVYGIPYYLILLAALLSLLTGAAVRILRERRLLELLKSGGQSADTITVGSREGTNQSDDEPVRTNGSPKEGGATEPQLIVQAEDQLERGDFEGAIKSSYIFVRKHVAESHGLDTGGTHWDFYNECKSSDGITDLESLYELTELYETAVFDTPSADQSDAILAIDNARKLTGHPSD